MIKTLVLYNPIAGGGKAKNIPLLIEKYLDTSLFKAKIIATEYAKHSTELTQKALLEEVELIIIAGGDGSINEVAKCLVNTDVKLGIIPTGSGNGIARHLKLPLNPKKAIQRINKFKVIKMDAGLWNDRFYLGFAGLGFDGYIAQLFSTSKKRGFLSYAKLVIKELSVFQPFSLRLTTNSNEQTYQNVFITCVANASQYGNNFKIAPFACSSDGKQTLIIVIRPKTTLGMVYLFLQSFLGSMTNNNNYHLHHFDEEITFSTNYHQAHIDGEHFTATSKVTCRILKEGVLVLI